MLVESNIKLTIAFTDPDLDLEEKEKQAHRLVCELRQIGEIEAVDRIIDPNPPKGSEAIGGMLLGFLTVEASIDNAKRLVSFLSDRLAGKFFQMSVENNGKKLTVGTQSQEDLEVVLQAAL